MDHEYIKEGITRARKVIPSSQSCTLVLQQSLETWIFIWDMWWTLLSEGGSRPELDRVLAVGVLHKLVFICQHNTEKNWSLHQLFKTMILSSRWILETFRPKLFCLLAWSPEAQNVSKFQQEGKEIKMSKNYHYPFGFSTFIFYMVVHQCVKNSESNALK